MHDPAGGVDHLVEFLARHRSVVALTGAGCSTESGIPDYRDANGDWKHARPVMYQQFVANDATRRRYWARSVVGWKRISGAQPNRAHHALARLEAAGFVRGIITQNVDGLHTRAGTRNVVDLHGRLDTVQCLACGALTDRAGFQTRLLEYNPHLANVAAETIAPDGDAVVADVDYASVTVPECEICGGMLKPHVVFFGEGVPPTRVAAAMQWLDDADALLVLGSSLMVFSGYRFVQAAVRNGKPVGVINLGRTRADDLVALKVQASCSDVLAAVEARLPGATTPYSSCWS